MTNASDTGASGLQVHPEGVTLERSEGVAVLTIDREPDLNRLTPDVLNRVGVLAEALREDAGSHVLVITGAGDDVFSMGILDPAIRASYSKDEIVRIVRLANRVFDAVEALPQIVIAAINGKVVAGGAELCLACDIRYAAGHATMAFPESAWGGFPGGGAPVRLPMLVGRARALELIATCREVDAREMERLGLVQGVFPRGRAREEATAVARRIAQHGPLAVRGAKRIAGARQAPGFQASRELSDALRQALEWSRDVDEGIAAHREHRKPKFSGR